MFRCCCGEASQSSGFNTRLRSGANVCSRRSQVQGSEPDGATESPFVLNRRSSEQSCSSVTNHVGTLAQPRLRPIPGVECNRSDPSQQNQPRLQHLDP